MINSRDIKELHPIVAAKAKQFLERAKAQGIDLIITSTYRDMESQAELYAKGRTSPGKKVTNAKPGQSYHNWRLAFDVVPIENGKAIWNDTALWARIGIIGESCGLEWAGRWKTFKETAHFQYTNGLKLADLQRGETLEKRSSATAK